MREAEFRGKRLDNGEWVYGYYCKSDEGEEGIKHIIMPFYSYEYVDGKTVGQYTGLKDKNGKKIYEGDILIQYDGTKRFVGYKNGSFTYTNIPKLEQTHNTFSMFYTEFTNPISKEWEVISNIYDNPELLELEGE